jgi:hypothetical protein
MVYRGIARGKVIELEDNVSLPEGTEVEVLIRCVFRTKPATHSDANRPPVPSKPATPWG